MKNIFFNSLLIITLVLTCSQANAALIVGGKLGNMGSNYSIYGSNAANAELNLLANHALYGDSIFFATSTSNANEAYLSGIDLYFTGLTYGEMPADELIALINFINRGGVVIATGDNTSFTSSVNSLLNTFGLNIVSPNNSSNSLISINNSSHQITNGPFGAVSHFTIRDSSNLAPATLEAEILGTYASGYGAIGLVDSNGTTRKGGLLFLPDSESFGYAGSFQGGENAKTLFNNSIAWAVDVKARSTDVPEPSTLAIFALGIMGLASRRFKKQS